MSAQLINEIVRVVSDAFLAEWRKSRGEIIVTELDMPEDLPAPRSGMTGEQLARYFDLQAKGEG